MGTCVLVRPGQTDYERQGRIVGALDMPLNEQGVSETTSIVDSVRPLAPKAVYCGPQEPALSTAKAIAKDLGVPVRELDDLGNVDQGLWQGLLVDDIRQKQPKLFKRWQDSPADVTPPSGEDCGAAATRVASALRKPLKRHESFVVVAVEPLATLVASLVRGEEPQLAGPTKQEDRPLVERIERGTPAEAATR